MALQATHRVPAPAVAMADRHGACFYGDDARLARRVADHLLEGLGRGDALLVIATPPHAALVAARLARSGVALDDLTAGGQYVFFDARTTLQRLMGPDGPDVRRFEEAVAAPLRRLFDDGRFAGVTAYGETEDLLWCDGWFTSALELEAMWNGLLDLCPARLLCAYRLDPTEGEWQNATAEHVGAVHTHTLLDEDHAAFVAAVEGAVEDVVGPQRAARIRQLVEAEAGHTAGAESTLFWVRRNLSSEAPAVMRETRHRLDAAAMHTGRARGSQ